MTFDQLLDSPTATREEKLVGAYLVAPHRISRGVFSLIDTIFNAPPSIRETLAHAFPRYEMAVFKVEHNALEVTL